MKGENPMRRNAWFWAFVAACLALACSEYFRLTDTVSTKDFVEFACVEKPN
jgi:hypothetical protein